MRFRSPLLSQSRFLSFPPGTEMVHFPGFARARLWIHRAVRRFYQRGFPHSEIPGSKPVCGSPRLIAAYHVLHRLLLPRHSPCALSSLTTKFTRCIRAEARSHREISWRHYLLIARTPDCSDHVHQQAALIKIYSLVDCPIYSVVKHRPHQLSLIAPPERVEHCCSKFGAKRLSLDRD